MSKEQGLYLNILTNVAKHITLTEEDMSYFLPLLKEKILSKKE